MRKTFAALAVAALTLAGCSTANDTTDEFTAPGGAPETNERGTITAQLGQTYEIGNCDGEACATFSVTKIAAGECEDPFEEPNGRIIDVHVNWQASDKLSDTYSYGLFNPGFWWVSDKDGNETENNGMNLNPPCPGSEDGIGDSLEAGASKQGLFKMQVPSNADRLLFEPMEGEETWDWQIPPEDAAPSSAAQPAVDGEHDTAPRANQQQSAPTARYTTQAGPTLPLDALDAAIERNNAPYEPAPDYYEPPAPAPAPAPEVYAPAPELPDGAGGGQAGY